MSALNLAAEAYMHALMRRLQGFISEGKRIPIPSSDLRSGFFSGSDLFLDFHSDYPERWGYAFVRYETGSRENASRLLEDLAKGGSTVFWQEIRGKRPGESHFTHRKTPGGHKSSFGEGTILPYDYVADIEPSMNDDYKVTVKRKGSGVIVTGTPWLREREKARSPEESLRYFQEKSRLIAQTIELFRPEGRKMIITRINQAIQRASKLFGD